MVTGIANRILYKMALVPLGNYVFFLAQFQTFGYVVVYFAVLALRRRCAMLLQSPRGRRSTTYPCSCLACKGTGLFCNGFRTCAVDVDIS